MPSNQRKEVDTEWAHSMHEITALAQAILNALVAQEDTGKADCFLAWVTGLHHAELMRTAVDNARAAGLSWREIAVITEGNGDAANRAERKQAWRSQRPL